MSGESSSRTEITIPQSQVDLLNELKKTGKPIAMILFTGRPLALTNVKDTPDAILNAGSQVQKQEMQSLMFFSEK
jgi:beta-glucosidase